MNPDSLSVSLRETLDCFGEPGVPRTTTEVADRLDLGRRSTYDRLKRLADRDHLETKKVGANGRVWWRTAAAAERHDAGRTLSRLVDNVPGLVYRCRNEPGWPMTFISDAATDVTGYDPEAITSGDVSWGEDVIHPEDRARVRNEVHAQLEAGTDFTVEYRIRTAAGETRWVSERGCAVVEGDSRTGVLEGVITDVTGAIEAERATAERDREFRMLVEAVEEYAIFMLDPDGRVRTWNLGAERITGYEADEIVGEHVSTFYTEADREAGVPDENLSAAAQRGSVEDEGWRVRRDGTEFWAGVTISAIHDDDGSLEGYAKVTRDMTDRREREQRLEAEHAFVESVLDNQHDLVYAFDRDGIPLRWNDRVREVTGYTDAELETMRYVDFVADEAVEETTAAFERVIEQGDRVTLELPFVTADGEEIPYEFTGGPLTDRSGDVVGLTGVGRDVSERKARERRLERQRDELETELQEIFERIDDGFFALDEEWRFTRVNDRAAELLDRSVGELVGTSIWAAFPEVVDTTFQTQYERAFETQESVTFEEFYPPLDTWFEVSAYPSESGLSVYLRDVSERKERKRELQRYEAIVDTVEDGIYVLDEDFRFVEVNDAYVEMTGYDRAELLGAHATLVVDDDVSAESAARLERIITEGDGSATLEADIHRADDTTLRAESRFTALQPTDTDRSWKVGVVRDVSERVERERKLVSQREQLAALNSLHEVVGDITEAVIEQSTREEIEETVCERLVDSRSYLFAWIGDVDTATQRVRFRTEAGTDGYLDDMEISVDPDDERSEGPTGLALRTGEIQTSRDIHEDPRFAPWRDHIEEYDCRSAAAIPIEHEGTVWGALNVYAERRNAFEGHERTVLSQLSEVVGHAIAAAERKQALMSDEVIELEFQIDNIFDAYGVEDGTDGRIALDHVLPITDDEYLIYGSATTDAVDTVRAMVDGITTWEEVTFRDGNGDTNFEARLSEPPILSVVASLGGSVEEAVIEDGDHRVVVHLSPNVEVRRVIDTVEETYPTVRLLKHEQITRSDTPDERTHDTLLSTLTERQRVTLEAAYHAGFFEWPREATGEDIAESLDVAPSTFHQHLRKGERKVVDAVVSAAAGSTG